MGRGRRRKKTKRLEPHQQQEKQQSHHLQQRLQHPKEEARKHKQGHPPKQQQDQHQGNHKRPPPHMVPGTYIRPQFNPKSPEWFFRYLEWLNVPCSSADPNCEVAVFELNYEAFEEDISDIEPSKKECTYDEDGSDCECELPFWREYTGDDEEEKLFREVKYQRAMFKREWVPESSKHYERKEKKRLERVGQQKNEKLKKVKSAVETLLRNVSRDEKRPLYYMSRNIMSKYDLFSEEYTARLCPDGIRTTRTIDFTDMASFHSMGYPRLKGTTELKVDRVLTGCLSIDAPNNPDDDIRVEFVSFECPQTTGVYKIRTGRKDGARELKVEFLSDDYIVLDVHPDAIFRDECGTKLPTWPRDPLPQYRFYGMNRALGSDTYYHR